MFFLKKEKKTHKGGKMALKNDQAFILFDQDWQDPLKEANPDIFLEQLESISGSSASCQASTMDGQYLEALLRIYIQSISFKGFFNLSKKMRRTIKNRYEFEELFVINSSFGIDDFLKVLNGGKFLNVFELTYMDKESGKFENGDLFNMEVRHSLISIAPPYENAFEKFYDLEMKKIQKLFDEWEKNKSYKPNFKNMHVFLFYNRENALSEFPKNEMNPSTLYLNGSPRNIYFYYVFSKKEQIFLNMTGRGSFTPVSMMEDVFYSKKQIQELKQELEKNKTKPTVFEY